MIRDVGCLLDIPIDRKSLAAIIEESLEATEKKVFQRVFACANPHSIVLAQNDLDFKTALTQADFVVADGIGVSYMARWAGVEIGPRITGTDYFLSILEALQRQGTGRVFFLGSSQLVLDRIAKCFVADYPALTLCGTLSPPFGSWSDGENRRMIEVINNAKPDVLWVGMTAPKQEKWVSENRQQVNVPVIGSIGAVFDFYAGTYARAPQWICRTGFEWVYRFIQEPRRMWRRNFVSAPKFIWLVLWRHVIGKEKVRGKRMEEHGTRNVRG